MIFCRYPITAEDIIALSNNSKIIPYNINEIIQEMNVEIWKRDEFRYEDLVCKVIFKNLISKNSVAGIIIKENLPEKIQRFLLARALYYAINDPNHKSNDSRNNNSYNFTSIELTNPYYDINDINANGFALDLLIPEKKLKEHKSLISDSTICDKTIELLSEYFNVTVEMIKTQLYYKGYKRHE